MSQTVRRSHPGKGLPRLPGLRSLARRASLAIAAFALGSAPLEASVPTGGSVHVIVDVSGYFD